MVHASELAAISVIMNATDLSTDQSGSALLFEQYENGSIRIKFLDGQEEHALPYVDCGHTDQLKVADCESINLIKKFNHLLSENWKDTCARQSNESQSDVLPYSESKAKQLINLIDRIRHQNQTLDLNPVFNRTPELIDLIERVGHKKHPGLRRQWKEHEVNEKERNVTQRDSDGEDAQNEDEDDDDDDDLKRLFKEELKKQGEEKVMRRRQRQQRKNKLRSLIRQIVNERLSDDYEEVVQEWQNRTKESKNAKVDFDRMAKRVWERVQAKKERQRQLMRRLVEQLDEKVNEKRRSRDEENADRIEMSSSKLKLLIDLVASLKAKHNRNDSNRATIERLVDSEVRRPAWDHHERRMVVGSAGNLESIDELDESDSDDEDDEDELDAGSSAENDVNADDNDDSDPTDNESTNDSKLSGMQRFLIKAAEYRANKMRQIHSYSERIQSRMAERRQRQADRLELEHKIESLLNREANIRVARLRDQLMSKMKQIRDSDNYVEQMYDFLDEDSSRDRLIGELRYQILAELLAYAKKSEQSETNDWSELINLLVNRRRLRSMAGIEADRLISEVTATNQHKSNQSNSVNVVSDSARLTNPIPTTILLRATATNDTTVQPSEATQSSKGNFSMTNHFQTEQLD